MASRDRATLDRVWSHIEAEELISLALTLGNVAAPTGYEGPLADVLADWLREQGLPVEKQQVYPERYNVLCRMPGRSGRTGVLFNSHMDSDVGAPEDLWGIEAEPDYDRAWREGDRIYGKTVLNDRGPLSCFLLAGLALKRAGVELKHDLLLTAAVGEIGMAPIDEFQGGRYVGKGIGARHLVTHGGLADFAVIGETTDYCPVWADCGVLYFKITVPGVSMYAPRVPKVDDLRRHPNAIVRASYLVQAIEEWGAAYTEQNTRRYAGGAIVPKVVIGAIRGGIPHKPKNTSGLCALYVDVLVPPGGDMQLPGVELRQVLERQGFGGQIQCFLSRRGYVAEGVDPLLAVLRESHVAVFGEPPGEAPAAVSSMWRDNNVFNEVGIPALNYGPPRRSDPGAKFARKYFLASDLLSTARVYAAIMLKLCAG